MEYRTPVGTFKTWEEAAAACERIDMDPCTCIEIPGDRAICNVLTHYDGEPEEPWT
jgi:hypothetical protein